MFPYKNMFTIPNQFLEPQRVDKKVNISVEVSLLEKQN